MSAAATNLPRQTDISAAGAATASPSSPARRSRVCCAINASVWPLRSILVRWTRTPARKNAIVVSRNTSSPWRIRGLLIDRLFGTRYQGECLFVTNAVPVDSNRCSATAVEARTAIDRVTGTARERHLFTTELVDGEVDLRGQIRARHPAGVLTQDDDDLPYEYALLVAGVLSLDTLGGDKSVGLGRCNMSIEPESLRWNGREETLPSALKSFEEPDWADMIDLLREQRP